MKTGLSAKALWLAGLLTGFALAGAAQAAGPEKANIEKAALTTRVIETPFAGSPRSIGSAANGCLSGAVALPLSGPGWETLRPARNRFWGNPALVRFIEDMAGRVSSSGRLLVLDMAQPRGGHMTSAHAAHQTGVDVDLMYRLASGPVTEAERAAPVLDSVIAEDGELNTARWGRTQTELLKAFASEPRVERIFVNPSIKRALCQSVSGDRRWLSRLRPWWGHDEHFHVRIRCPQGDKDCIPGPPLPAGDGCGAELAWWFSKEATLPKPPAGPKSIYRPTMPRACKAILEGP